MGGGGAVDSLYSKQSLPAPSVPGNYGVQEVAGLAIKRKSRKKVQIDKQTQLALMQRC